MSNKMLLNNNLPWIDKFKPTSVKNIVINLYVKNKIIKYVENKIVINSVFCGPPGVGKTLIANCIGNDIYGKYAKDSILFINCSDDRGIKIVQNTIETFCKKKRVSKKIKHKLIILDEADNTTVNTQQLINSLIENYKETTRFIFTCNDHTKLIEAIQSRCSLIKFPFLQENETLKCLNLICKMENINCSTKSLKAIHIISQGDIRCAINTLQLVYSNFKDKITEKKIFELVNKPHPDEMKHMLLYCYNNNLPEAIKNLEEFQLKGYSSSDIILSMLYTIRCYLYDLPEHIKIKFLHHISETCIIISRGVTSEIQLTSCLCKLCS